MEISDYYLLYYYTYSPEVVVSVIRCKIQTKREDEHFAVFLVSFNTKSTQSILPFFKSNLLLSHHFHCGIVTKISSNLHQPWNVRYVLKVFAAERFPQ